MKIHLHVKAEYFDAVKAGTKKFEYRLVNEYWSKRLINRTYDGVVYYNGYKPGDENRMEFPWNGWEEKPIIHPHFGADPVKVFAIPLVLP